MVADPKILLADEPTGALDSKSGLQVMELFDTLHKQGVTIIMITHSDEIASYADRVVRIIDGELYEGDARPAEETSEMQGIPSAVTPAPELVQEAMTGGEAYE